MTLRGSLPERGGEPMLPPGRAGRSKGEKPKDIRFATVTKGAGRAPLKGSLVALAGERKKEEVRSGEVELQALDIYQIGGEDGKPVAKEITAGGGKAWVLGVTDGLGGAASMMCKLKDGSQVSSAMVGATETSTIIDEFAENEQELIVTGEMDQVQAELTKRLTGRIGTLPERYPLVESKLKGGIIKPFATTMSMAIVRENGDDWDVTLLWSGDSPLTIISQDGLITTAEPETGDAPMEGSLAPSTLKKFGLWRYSVSVPKKDGLVVVAATDAIAKPFDNALPFLAEVLENGQDARSAYLEKYSKPDSLSYELDDFTLAVARFPGSDGLLNEALEWGDDKKRTVAEAS